MNTENTFNPHEWLEIKGTESEHPASSYILSMQYPSECCPFIKTFSYICGAIRFYRLTLHIVKVFFASPK